MPNRPKIEIAIFSQNDKEFKDCEFFEYSVFQKNQYVEANPEQRIHYFDKFESQSMIAVYLEGQMVGAVRMIYSSKEKMESHLFPTLDAIARLKDENPGEQITFPEVEAKLYALAPRHLVDISTISTNTSKTKPILMLFPAIFEHMKSTNKPIGLAFNDVPFHKKMLRLGIPWTEIGPPIFYWGSDSIPAFVHINRVQLKR